MRPIHPVNGASLHLLRFFSWLALALALAGCPAVFPELGTRTRVIPQGRPLDPPPPSDVRWIRIASATIPPRTRDGRAWSTSGKSDPYAKLFINGKEVFRTPVQSNTLSPTWPDGPRGNFRIGTDDKLRVELWDSSPINDKPICVEDIGHIGEGVLLEKRIRIHCESGAEIQLAYEDAHALQGTGLWYELRSDSAYITRMLEGSPAQRAGLAPGDEILELNGRKLKTMSPDEVKSTLNAIPFGGLPMMVRHASGATFSLLLKEGPIYPLYEQFGSLD